MTLKVTVKINHCDFGKDNGTEAARLLRLLAEEIDGLALRPLSKKYGIGFITRLHGLNGKPALEAVVIR